MVWVWIYLGTVVFCMLSMVVFCIDVAHEIKKQGIKQPKGQITFLRQASGLFKLFVMCAFPIINVALGLHALFSKSARESSVEEHRKTAINENV